MTNLILKLVARIRAAFGFAAQRPAQRSLPLAPVEAPKPKKARRAAPSLKDSPDNGAFYYLGTILDDLPRLHRLLKKMKRVDPEAYAFHAKVGARILPGSDIVDVETAPAFIPATGMVFAGGRKEGDFTQAAFVYFNKYNQSYRLKPSGQTAYSVCVAHIMDNIDHVCEFFVTVTNGKIQLCNSLQTELRRVPVRETGMARRWTGTRFHAIKTQYFGPSQSLLAWAKEKGEDPETLARMLFCSAVTGSSASTEGEFMVRCKRAGSTATFFVSPKRTPYFFADRETTLAVDGRKKRIFHHVRAHERTLPDGRKSQVPEHYRGERHFKWGGDMVTISVPNVHHNDIRQFDAAAMEVEARANVPRGTLGTEEMARKFAAHLEGDMRQ